MRSRVLAVSVHILTASGAVWGVLALLAISAGRWKAAFAWMGHRPGEFPIAEYVGENGLHFGCHQYLTEADLEFAADTLHEYFEAR